MFYVLCYNVEFYLEFINVFKMIILNVMIIDGYINCLKLC